MSWFFPGSSHTYQVWNESSCWRSFAHARPNCNFCWEFAPFHCSQKLLSASRKSQLIIQDSSLPLYHFSGGAYGGGSAAILKRPEDLWVRWHLIFSDFVSLLNISHYMSCISGIFIFILWINCFHNLLLKIQRKYRGFYAISCKCTELALSLCNLLPWTNWRFYLWFFDHLNGEAMGFSFVFFLKKIIHLFSHCASIRYDTIFSFKNNARDKSKYK